MKSYRDMNEEERIEYARDKGGNGGMHAWAIFVVSTIIFGLWVTNTAMGQGVDREASRFLVMMGTFLYPIFYFLLTEIAPRVALYTLLALVLLRRRR